MNLERPIPTAQVPDDISADVTWNLESPNPADISNRLEFKVFPDKGEPCELPNCKRPKPTRKRNLKFVQCTNEDCKTWCHYDCANIPFKTTFTRDQVYLCPLCVPHESPHREYDQTHTEDTITLNNRGLPARKKALKAKRKIKYMK